MSGARYNYRVLDERDPQEPVLSLSKGWVLKALREAGNCLLSELYGLDEEELRCRRGMTASGLVRVDGVGHALALGVG